MQSSGKGRNRVLVLAALAGAAGAAVVASGGAATSTRAAEPSRLCVVWSSADPGVARNVCFMYTHNAKRAKWFDQVVLVVWGPSAKLLAEDADLQAQVKAMQSSGVAVEACVVCARNYGVAEALKDLGLDVKGMGKPLSDRLKAGWKVLTF